MGFPDKRLITFGTRVWAFARVISPVQNQSVLMSEMFAACITTKRLFTRMYEHMFLETLEIGKFTKNYSTLVQLSLLLPLSRLIAVHKSYTQTVYFFYALAVHAFGARVRS